MDYVSPTQFKFTITQLPKVEFFVTNCNLPGISLGETIFPTPFKPIPVQGDELTFDNLSIGFQVSENLENYIELHNWLLAIGFPKSRQQFATHRSTTSNTSNTTRGGTTNDIGKVELQTPANPMFSDATLTILSNKNNPVAEIRFEDIYPTTIGALSFDQEAADTQYIKTTADFSYKLYTIVKL